ncbi:uncharacterized protein ATC70_009839 [Mucor velutinosus]|uniref:Uncharacterized protein n=1 Tax=Mucor velutinosus TaxID=708070 RepID=A0AAN7DLI2_9FUNG|nr:hypothetical protein ATC70_009839 [Mucor velutinosus]
MAKKGNKKKSNARKVQQQKKVITTPTATTAPATPEESSPVTPVNALADNDKALLTEEPQVAAAAVAEKEIEQIEKEGSEENIKPVVTEKKEEVQEEEETAEKPSILSNASEEALTSTSENIVESLQVKDALEEPPHVEVKAEPVAVVLDSLPETEQPVVITLEKAIIPEEQQTTIEVEPVPEEISPVLPKVETEEDIPLLQEKKQDQEPVVLVVSESETTSSTSAKEEEKKEATTAADQGQWTYQAVGEQDAQVNATESDSTKPEEAPLKTEQEPEQAITHENDQVPEQKEPKSLLVPQATECEAKNVQEPHVSEPTITPSVSVEEEPVQEQTSAPVSTTTSASTTEPIDVSKVAPPIVIVNNVDQHQEQAQADVDVPAQADVNAPAQTEKETAPPVSTTSLEKEDTPTIRSQSVLTSINTDATIQEEEIATPKSSLKKKRSILGKENKSVTKRKSQILGLFKRGGDKTPPVPELPVIQQATEKKQQPEKKLNKRKSWMFWKSSNTNATAVATVQPKN